MITHFIRLEASLLLVTCLGISAKTMSQTSSPIPQTRAAELMSAGDAGILRSDLTNLSGKAGVVKLAEKITISGKDHTFSCELVSQLVSLKTGDAEQVHLRITDGAKTIIYDFVQMPDGKLSEHRGNGFAAYSHTEEVRECIGGKTGTGSCTDCHNRTNSSLHGTASIARKVSIFLKNAGGSCLGCFGDLDDVIECITGHNP